VQARLESLLGLVKARFISQTIKTNRALLEYSNQVEQDDLLPRRLPTKVKKAKWIKPINAHGNASRRGLTGVEAAEKAADQAERADIRPIDPWNGSDDEGVVVPATPPRVAESQGGNSIFILDVKTPERLRPPPDLAPTLEASPEASPEGLELPASTAPARMEQGRSKRRKVANTLYRNSQYEME
jgi:hypothetical protein